MRRPKKGQKLTQLGPAGAQDPGDKRTDDDPANANSGYADEVYDEFLTRAPAVGRMGEYMAGVVHAAKLRGMSLERLSGQYESMEVSNKNVVHPVSEMGIKGRFLDMGRFLEELSGQTAYGSIKQARIAYDEKEYPVLSGRFVIEFKALKERAREGK
jgi:hypothetical protein